MNLPKLKFCPSFFAAVTHRCVVIMWKQERQQFRDCLRVLNDRKRSVRIGESPGMLDRQRGERSQTAIFRVGTTGECTPAK